MFIFEIDFVSANLSEKPALLDLDLQNNPDFSWDETEWQNKLKSKTFVCKQAIFSGTLVGIVAYSIHDKNIEIEKLVVSSSAKGQGVAKFMLSKVIEEQKSNKVKNIFATINKKNIPALNIFSQLGFVKEKSNKLDVVVKKQIL